MIPLQESELLLKKHQYDSDIKDILNLLKKKSKGFIHVSTPNEIEKNKRNKIFQKFYY